MKYLILRCEDVARAGEQTAALFQGAKVSYLQHLAQGGAAGVVRDRDPRRAIDRFHFHRAMFGLLPGDAEAAPGQCYAAGAEIPVEAGATAWCCELVTHQDGRIIDATAGNIPTKESEVLIGALNDRLGSDRRRWGVGRGAHHVFLVRESLLDIDSGQLLRSPHLLVGQAWRRHLPKGAAGESLRALIQEASKVLEGHPVNRVRVDLGENPANMLWCWGGVQGGPQRTVSARSGLSGAVVSNSFSVKGLARCLGLEWRDGPATLSESALQRLAKTVAELLAARDVVYVHLSIDASDPVDRLCVMERIDQVLLKPLTERLPARGPWRLLAAVDDRVTGSIPFVAIGSGLPQHPAAHLTAQDFAESRLVFQDGAGLFAWLTAA